MEPVGGGRLAKLPAEAENLLKNQRPDDSIASWAIRFTASLPNVIVTLSGMSDIEQLTDNLSVFNMPVSLSMIEQSILHSVVEILSGYNTIPCTTCGYCVKECPRVVDIPQIFTRFNDYVQFENATRFDIDYHAFVPLHRRASNCVSCGLCIEKCPQKIDIPKELDAVHKKAIELSIGVDIESLRAQLNDNTLLVCFGAGAGGHAAKSTLREYGYTIDYFCDNSKSLWGSEIDGIKILSPTQLQELNAKQKIHVLITNSYYKEVKEQLGSLGICVL
jgi:ferredoxin